MKINEYGTITPTGKLKKRNVSSSSSASFADMLDSSSADGADAVSSLSDVSPAAPLDNMLALQEISDEEIGRRKLIQQGSELVDELDNLRNQLLSGNMPLSTLQSLESSLSMKKQTVNDPRLISIIDDIELRAAVELAKLRKAQSGL